MTPKELYDKIKQIESNSDTIRHDGKYNWEEVKELIMKEITLAMIEWKTEGYEAGWKECEKVVMDAFTESLKNVCKK